jgi:starch-binding outer membrane protein SusE/F
MKTKLLLLLAVFMTAFGVNAQLPAGSTVAIVGASVGGWPDNDPATPDALQMSSTDGENWTITTPVFYGVADAGIKFRANNSWNDGGSTPPGGNWGKPVSGPSWPGGVGNNSGGSANIIPVGTAGQSDVYVVTFNSTTGVYNFAGGAPIPVVKLVGTAVTSGTITLSPTSPGIYTLPLTTFLAGTANFEIDGVLIAGGNTFPSGDTSTGTAITIPAGAYTSVTYNNDLGTYEFVAAPTTFKISIVGSATTVGWPSGTQIDTIIMKNVDNGNENYRISEIPLLAIDNLGNPAKLKFRENDDWNPSYGGTSFPTGPIANNNEDIVVDIAKDYSATFVRSTKAYSFFTPKIGLIGDGNGGWGDGAEVPMITTDGITYLLLNRVMVGGPVKFRLDQNWDKSWGGVYGTGSGTATSASGPNINVPAGTYDVQFNRVTGAFVFAAAGSLVNNTFDNSAFKVYPNPTQSNWNFTSSKEAIVSVQVIDILGKVVATANTANVDASALNAGVYFAKVTTATATATVKVIKN